MWQAQIKDEKLAAQAAGLSGGAEGKAQEEEEQQEEEGGKTKTD